MRVWVGTRTAGQKGQTRGPPSACETDVRQEDKDVSSCFFTDLCRLNGDRPRGAPSKEYKERERTHDLLVVSYVSSYDVSSNPSVGDGESIQSVKNNRRSLVEHWWYYSSGRAQEMCFANEWSGGLKPTVFQKTLEVILESAAQDVGEGTGGDGKQQADEDEHRRYDYKDPNIQLLSRSYCTSGGRPKENISRGEITRNGKRSAKIPTFLIPRSLPYLTRTLFLKQVGYDRVRGRND
jgi:hypothetical protein